MRLADIDYAATSGDSVLHHASARAKLTAFALMLAAVVLTTDVLLLWAIALTLVAAQTVIGLPVRRILTTAMYPVFFAIVFAVSASTDLVSGMLVIVKASTAALVAVTLVYTTPYPQVFAPLQRVLPPLVADSMLVTYRSFFLLTERLERLFTAMRLRSAGAEASLTKRIRQTSRALANLILYSFDLAQRDYDVLKLRGYEGSFILGAQPRRSSTAGTVVVGFATIMFSTTLAWRLATDTLAPLGWVFAAMSIVGLVVAMVIRALHRSKPEVT